MTSPLRLSTSTRTCRQAVSPAAAPSGREAGSRPMLFEPLQLREMQVPNRIFLSPMCQYSAQDGLPNQWHLVHLGARATGGCGLVMTEAAAVTPEGRISPQDVGIWNEEQVQAWRPIVDFIRSQGAVPAIQLAHAGRKASNCPPFIEGGRPLWPGRDAGAWEPLGPSAVPFTPSHPTPREMSEADIAATVEAFVEGAKRAVRAGFQVIELHMAHGYLLHEFLSPLSNRRTDRWGGSLANRMRLSLGVAAAVRAALPAGTPLLVRISATDWADPAADGGAGWDADQSVALVRALREAADVDLVDVSSGGLLPRAPPSLGPGYQVPFAERIRRETGALTGAVGLITEPQQAEQALAAGKADAVFLGRELLRDPHWPLRAAAALGYRELRYPPQYERGKFPAPRL